MPADKVIYYNRIDIGISLSVLELCLAHEGISFDRRMYGSERSDKLNGKDNTLKVTRQELAAL